MILEYIFKIPFGPYIRIVMDDGSGTLWMHFDNELFFRTKENHIKSNRELTCWCGFCNVMQRLKFVLQNNLMRFSAFGPLA